jgi:hypothetical protein
MEAKESIAIIFFFAIVLDLLWLDWSGSIVLLCIAIYIQRGSLLIYIRIYNVK